MYALAQIQKMEVTLFSAVAVVLQVPKLTIVVNI
jgi:hypothetical protein